MNRPLSQGSTFDYWGISLLNIAHQLIFSTQSIEKLVIFFPLFLHLVKNFIYKKYICFLSQKKIFIQIFTTVEINVLEEQCMGL